uniref:Uncharacterized protein n=1 Tax=Rhizophora mucronata TaxID=61149 RepID=A0A2P2QZ71_RHIMU
MVHHNMESYKFELQKQLYENKDRIVYIESFLRPHRNFTHWDTFLFKIFIKVKNFKRDTKL